MLPGNFIGNFPSGLILLGRVDVDPGNLKNKKVFGILGHETIHQEFPVTCGSDNFDLNIPIQVNTDFKLK